MGIARDRAVMEEKEQDRHWYVIHTYSGYENKVKTNLEHRIDSMDMKDKIFQVIVPTEEEIEVKDGQRRTVERKIFPGYLLVEMVNTDESWSVVRNTPGVTGFVSAQDEKGRPIPTPLDEEEVKSILRRMTSATPRVKVGLNKGQTVRITDGPFTDFIGIVEEVYPDKGKVRIMVSIFGRDTPLELDFLQVERV